MQGMALAGSIASLRWEAVTSAIFLRGLIFCHFQKPSILNPPQVRPLLVFITFISCQLVDCNRFVAASIFFLIVAASPLELVQW